MKRGKLFEKNTPKLKKKRFVTSEGYLKSEDQKQKLMVRMVLLMKVLRTLLVVALRYI